MSLIMNNLLKIKGCFQHESLSDDLTKFMLNYQTEWKIKREWTKPPEGTELADDRKKEKRNA